MSLSEAKAGLFLAYWMDPGTEKGEEKSNILQQVQVTAAGEMISNGVIDTAVFVAGQIYPGRRAVAFVMASEMQSQFPYLNCTQIFADPMGMDTKGEITKFYAEGAIVKPWQPTLIVGIDPHIPRIRFVNQRINRFGQSAVEVRGSTSYLENDPKLAGKYQELLAAYYASKDLASFGSQEKLLLFVEQFGLGERLDWLSENIPYKPAIQVAVLQALSLFKR